MSQTTQVHLLISGRVQGVCFRLETRRSARGLGVSGWVRNLPDGRVEALGQGEKEDVAAFVDWCRQGPRMARVDGMQIRWETPSKRFDDFEITR